MLGSGARAYKALLLLRSLNSAASFLFHQHLLERDAQEALRSILRSGGRGVQGSRSNTKELSGGKLFQCRCQAEQTCGTRHESVKGDNATGARS